jgi:hypothetical protein
MSENGSGMDHRIDICLVHRKIAEIDQPRCHGLGPSPCGSGSQSFLCLAQRGTVTFNVPNGLIREKHPDFDRLLGGQRPQVLPETLRDNGAILGTDRSRLVGRQGVGPDDRAANQIEYEEERDGPL